jgi:SAM-dependent methyltransferase
VSQETRLLCPLDALPLERVPAGVDGLAVHFCGRHEYPEVDGIPVLLDTPAAGRALERARLGEAAAARAELLAPDRWSRANTWARAADRLSGSPRFAAALRSRRVARFLRRHPATSLATYRDALAALLLEPPAPQPESFAYFLNRPSDPTFVVAEAVTSAVPRRGAILDVCCGAGHLTRRLSTDPGAQVTALDESFSLLWLARTFLAPAARPVCARADRALPFPPRSFDAVVCSDALHDTEQPAGLAREIVRVLARSGTAFVIHLHNPAFEHHYRGRNPLAPRGYAAIFAEANPRLFDEGPILERWLREATVDLTDPRPPEGLDAARTVTLVAGGDVRAEEAPRRDDGTIALSPLYVATAEGDGLRLERRWPSASYVTEYPDAPSYLPERATLAAASIAALLDGRLDAAAGELVRRRVLVNVPERYGAERPWRRRA